MEGFAHFIKPLEEKGFVLQSIGVMGADQACHGVNVLIFESDPKFDLEDMPEIRRICEQDDDSQPCSSCRYWMGTLWLYIPYQA